MTPDALFRATEIHLRYPSKDWPAAIALEPAEHQATIREYFVGIAARIRVVRNLRHQSGVVPHRQAVKVRG